jgi:hypothetical protein
MTTPPELTEDRIRFVLKEHPRLLRKLNRMPGAHTMLSVPRLPDAQAAETIMDVVRPQIATDLRDVMDAAEALRAEYSRILAIYGLVMRLGEEAAARDVREMQARTSGHDPHLTPSRVMGIPVESPVTEADVHAVAQCLDDVEKAEPKFRMIRKAVEKRGK